jgi:hypothetical protein
MKKLIVIAALIAISTQAAAFWGWNDNRDYGNGYSNGVVDGVGNADGEADFVFDFSMTASMRGDVRGFGTGNGYGYGNGYNSHIPYYGAPYGYLPPVPASAAEAR